MVYMVMLSLMAANPSNFTIFHGIFGFLLHGGFWIAIFTYLRLRKEIALETLITLGLANVETIKKNNNKINKISFNAPVCTSG